MAKVMAIDYGERRVGIAMADTAVPIAFPRETIDRKVTPLMERLRHLIQSEKVQTLVIGWPVHPEGKPQSRHLVVQTFVDDLRREFPDIPLHLHDESYSSMAALERTSHISSKRKKDKGVVDRAAATIVLQEWLDQ